MDTEPDVQDAPDAMRCNSCVGDIEFRDVTFGYENHAKVLKEHRPEDPRGRDGGVRRSFRRGQNDDVQPASAVLRDRRRQIAIDGIDIRQMTQQSLRRQIGIVQQDVFLFSGTMRENIAYGKLDATESEIWEAARRAQLRGDASSPCRTDWIRSIGERGVKLSGGQKQRLAIARMFLKNPPILILDEATSALDTETEAAIQQSLAELSQGRTTLVIAHRLATIKNADRIVVVTEDGITEQGRHEELIAAGGVYAGCSRRSSA